MTDPDTRSLAAPSPAATGSAAPSPAPAPFAPPPGAGKPGMVFAVLALAVFISTLDVLVPSNEHTIV
jgi:hypothetical protein